MNRGVTSTDVSMQCLVRKQSDHSSWKGCTAVITLTSCPVYRGQIHQSWQTSLLCHAANKLAHCRRLQCVFFCKIKYRGHLFQERFQRIWQRPPEALGLAAQSLTNTALSLQGRPWLKAMLPHFDRVRGYLTHTACPPKNRSVEGRTRNAFIAQNGENNTSA